MSKKKYIKPTDSELEVLQILWQKEPCTVRLVNDILNQKKVVGYTTTLKIMQIMAEKGLVERDTSSRTHLYTANVSETNTQKGLLQQFLTSTFRGSAMKLVLQALGDNDTSKEELEEIKALIEQKEKSPKS